uniref:Uncharacterized protein n=1 Tax=Capra hircus TaxID=9925 RepID=A0A8C2NKZ0_CAPHI
EPAVLATQPASRTFSLRVLFPGDSRAEELVSAEGPRTWKRIGVSNHGRTPLLSTPIRGRFAGAVHRAPVSAELYLLTSWYKGQLKKSIRNSLFQRMRSTTSDHLEKTLERMLQISESSFLYWKEILSFQNSSEKSSSFPVFFESAHQGYNFGHTMM